MMQAIPWGRVVELARQARQEYAERGAVEVDTVLRLARAVLLFQEYLVGRFVRPRRIS
jgi:hypothetical protein